MTKVIGIENKTVAGIFAEIGNGSRFVAHQYCISIFIMSFKRTRAIYFVREGERRWGPTLGCGAVSLLLGWWGIPWGPIWTVGTLYDNAVGGKDVTEAVMTALQSLPGDTLIAGKSVGNLAHVFD